MKGAEKSKYTQRLTKWQMEKKTIKENNEWMEVEEGK